MAIRFISAASLLLSSVGATILPASPAQAQTSPLPAPRVQCVKNVLGAGLIVKVYWFDPATVIYTPADPAGDKPLTTDFDEVDREDRGQRLPRSRRYDLPGQEVCVGG